MKASSSNLRLNFNPAIRTIEYIDSSSQGYFAQNMFCKQICSISDYTPQLGGGLSKLVAIGSYVQ